MSTRFGLLGLAGRNLSRNRRRTLTCLVAIVFGVTAALVARGFITAQHHALLDGTVHGELGALQVHARGYAAALLRSPLQFSMPDDGQVTEVIRAVPGVTAVAPRIHFGALFTLPDEGGQEPPPSTFLQVAAVDPSRELEVAPFRKQALAQGAFLPRTPEGALLLHADVARALGVSPVAAPEADTASWPALLATDRDGAANGELVWMAGTLHSLTPGDRRVALTTVEVAQRLLRMEGRVTEYAVAVADLGEVERVRAELARRLGDGYEVHTWADRAPHLRELIATQDAVFSAFTVIFLLVVLLGVVNAQLMSVMERVPEIGTMLALGTRRAQVRLLFVFEGLWLGAAGGVAGALLGLAAVGALHAWGIEMPLAGATAAMTLLPVVGVQDVVFTILAVTLGAGIAALWPAARASALRPVEALRTT